MIAETSQVVIEAGWSFDLASYFIGLGIGLIIGWMNR